ncbi:MAG: hypothetical protein ACK5ML_01630 [Lachnospiraceae bacterium]
MGFNPVELNGVIQRSQDVGLIKHKEDSKPFLDQLNIQAHEKKEQEKQLSRIKGTEETRKEGFRYDAKEKGSGSNEEYHSKEKRRKKKADQDDTVIVKTEGGHFDIKI